MKGNTSKSDRSKKQVNPALTFEKYQIKNRSNVFAIIMATIIIMIIICWILSGFGLGVAYYLLQKKHYVWASIIILIDVLIVRSYIKTKKNN
jgi:hypothetical protein